MEHVLGFLVRHTGSTGTGLKHRKGKLSSKNVSFRGNILATERMMFTENRYFVW